MAKKKQQKFSVVKAVKANARERVGQPPPGRVIQDQKPGEDRKPRDRQTLPDLLEEQ